MRPPKWRWPPGRWAPISVPACSEQGIDAGVSSWQRFAPNTIPSGAKAGGNYLSGQLIAREARRLGLRRGHRARLHRSALGRRRREPVPRVRRRAAHHARQRRHPRTASPATRIMTLAQDAGMKSSSGTSPREIPLLRRRSLHVRHRGRDHPHTLRGWQAGGRRQTRPVDRCACRSCSSACSRAPRPTSTAGSTRSVKISHIYL